MYAIIPNWRDSKGYIKAINPLVLEIAMPCIDSENRNARTPISLCHAITTNQSQDTLQDILEKWARSIRRLHNDYKWKPACFIIDGAMGEFNVSFLFQNQCDGCARTRV